MSVSVENLEGLSRRLTIVVPTDEVEEKYQARLKDVAKTAKLKGFRPGKVPVNIVDQRYGKDIRQEISGELMQSHFRDALLEQELQIAGSPQIKPSQSAVGEPLEFVIEFEVYPEITLNDLSQAKVERFTAEITDKDVEDILEKLSKQQAEWTEVTRACAQGDRVNIDFEGTVKGELFEGGASKDFQLELGSNSMIPGFEDGIVGMAPGDVKDIKVTFPKDYQSEELAGKKAVFKITLHTVSEPELPELNDAFAEKMGIEKDGMEGLKKTIRENLEREAKRVVQMSLKTDVLDVLLQLNPIDVPGSLVDAEVGHLQGMTSQRMAGQFQEADLSKIDLPREPYEKQAKRRVAIGLLLGEVIKANDIKVDASKVRERIEALAQSYPNPEEVVTWYYNNKQALTEIESGTFEDLAVEALVSQMTVEDKTTTYEAAVKRAEEQSAKEAE